MPERLTHRQLEHLAGAARGETQAQTAARLFVSVEAVKSMRKELISRMHARNITHAVFLATRRGLLR